MKHLLIPISVLSLGLLFITPTMAMNDQDGDGQDDTVDVCPTIANPAGIFLQLPNCTDADNDGFEDTLGDLCPGVSGTQNGCIAQETLPVCTVPPLVQEGDRFIIQLKNTGYVSEPFFPR